MVAAITVADMKGTYLVRAAAEIDRPNSSSDHVVFSAIFIRKALRRLAM